MWVCTEVFVGGVPMNTAAETECVGSSSSLTVIDVFNALQSGYAFISGTISRLSRKNIADQIKLMGCV